MTIEEKRRHRAAETNPRIRAKSAVYPLMVTARVVSRWKAAKAETKPAQPDAQLAAEPPAEPPAGPAPQLRAAPERPAAAQPAMFILTPS